MNFDRSSGILIHLTSLPSAYGIGDMGPAAYQFIDFMAEAGQHYWQLLPLSPTRLENGNSPYSSPSAFAGNVLLISTEELIREGYIAKSDLPSSHGFEEERVNFKAVVDYKVPLLDRAFYNWKDSSPSEAYRKFCNENRHWLDDYAIYMALRSDHGDKDWVNWERSLRHHEGDFFEKTIHRLDEKIDKEKFLQFLFYRQWERLKKYARKKEVKLIGDVPFYVSHDSADCWAHPDIFKLNEDFQPSVVSGVPPDFFSDTGQLWGSPVFDWSELKKQKYSWWIDRLRQNLTQFDVVRLDHFRAFTAYWEVPADEETAVNGKWIKTPGNDFFKHLEKAFPEMPFVAEDLGIIDQPVYDLRDRFELPGMLVLQFGFDDEFGEFRFIPHNHIQNAIVYTGTHDNTTARGWWKEANNLTRKNFQEYLDRKVTHANVAENMQRLALQSVAQLAILPMQDVLGLGPEAIMNLPGTAKGNWEWRMKPGMANDSLAQKLRHLNEVFGRNNKLKNRGK